jgi:sulfite exporter TauE/SafE
MGLYIADWWRVLVGLERVGQVIWQRIQPMAIRLGKPDRLTKAIGVGMLWGWLPCGLVYSALGQALASGSPAKGAALMAAFGLGTLPAMLAGSWFPHHLALWLQSRSLRRLMGLIIIGMGLWMLWQIHMPSPHAHHH